MTIETLYSIAVLGGLGFIFGLILSFVSIKLSVEEDPKLVAIKDLLPGVNCGVCGFPGCDAFAVAVFEGKAKTNGCPIGKRSNLTQKLEEILNQ
jgi:RnfABCDGE-type electron transport complex B subunit